MLSPIVWLWIMEFVIVGESADYWYRHGGDDVASGPVRQVSALRDMRQGPPLRLG